MKKKNPSNPVTVSLQQPQGYGLVLADSNQILSGMVNLKKESIFRQDLLPQRPETSVGPKSKSKLVPATIKNKALQQVYGQTTQINEQYREMMKDQVNSTKNKGQNRPQSNVFQRSSQKAQPGVYQPIKQNLCGVQSPVQIIKTKGSPMKLNPAKLSFQTNYQKPIVSNQVKHTANISTNQSMQVAQNES